MITKEQLWEVMADGMMSRNELYSTRKQANPDAKLYRWKSVKACVTGHPTRVRYLAFAGSDFHNNRPTDLWVYGPDKITVMARINLETGGHRLDQLTLA